VNCMKRARLKKGKASARKHRLKSYIKPKIVGYHGYFIRLQPMGTNGFSWEVSNMKNCEEVNYGSSVAFYPDNEKQAKKRAMEFIDEHLHR